MDWQAIGAISNAILVAALVCVTIYYAKQTRKQADSMQGQLGEMRSQRELMADQLEEIRRDRKIQRLNMEMDKLVGQLKSRLEDKDIFPKNFEPITSRIKGSIRESND